ncbi:MAG: DUF294 nucleotidyltransferase-like domain-containing protein [Nitrospirota bacterium]
MIVEEIVEFFRNTPPFTLLDDTTLTAVAGAVSIEFHPKEHIILRQGGPAVDALSIIRKGGVKVIIRTGEGEDIFIEHLGAGDSFGLLSLVSGDISRGTVVAAEDTTCYLIDKKTVLNLIATNAAFSAFYLNYFVKHFINTVYREIQDRNLLCGGGDKLLFTVALDDLISKEIVTAPQNIPIREAAEMMFRHNVSSLVLLDEDNFPAGIVTDKDLRNKVVAKGRDVGEAVSAIMSATLIKSEARDFCFEALLKMIRYNIHHLLVIDRGDIRGMITSHDLMLMQGASPLAIVREIELQKSIEGLIPVSRRIDKTITVLVQEEAKASTITRIITEINDRLVRKVLEIAERKFGRPPVPFCWIAFGSEGRKEQTFRTDQDNAIIYDDPQAGAEEVKAYFARFAHYINEALVKCGFAPCPAGYMASNPRWQQPLSVWRRYFSEWITAPTPEAVLSSLIFFDFRPVYGDITLAERLRAYLGTILKSRPLFFAHMAGKISQSRPPLSFWKTLVVEKSGAHKNTIDIKTNGLSYIVDTARLFALERGVPATSTLTRLRELRDTRCAVAELCNELEQAFEFLMALRLRHQFGQMHNGGTPDNYIDPGKLSGLERKVLEETFKVITRAQESIKIHYNTWTVR